MGRSGVVLLECAGNICFIRAELFTESLLALVENSPATWEMVGAALSLRHRKYMFGRLAKPGRQCSVDALGAAMLDCMYLFVLEKPEWGDVKGDVSIDVILQPDMQSGRAPGCTVMLGRLVRHRWDPVHGTKGNSILT